MSMTEPTPPQKSKVAEREEQILEFWRQNQTFKKTLKKPSPKGPFGWAQGKEFTFYDGPPFATGLPHYGHILAGTIKDVVPRFKTMQGYHVPRRWGWDCHGLPVENEVEKELGFKTKKEILDFGIAKFNAKAKETVMRYANEWRRIIPRLGRWVDMDNDYRTMDASYTESVWWAFKKLFEQGLIVEGFKPMHLCPRCETTLSNFEVTQGYKEITDTSVYVRFALRSAPGTFLVAWTTTPWTLPGNVALAVNPDLPYAFIEITASNAPEWRTGDIYITNASEAILRKIFGTDSFVFDPVAKVGSFVSRGQAVSFSSAKGVKGRELVGQSYLPLFGYSVDATLPNRERGWHVYSADFVTAEDGTGIVHIAPAFGADDYELAVKEHLPFIQHIATDGTFKKEITDFAGLQAKPKGNPKETDEKIIAYLSAHGGVIRSEPHTHDYPHCWRCDTPLLNFAAPSWFVRVTELREQLTAENTKVKWVPREVGQYRFGNWLKDAKDWAISRSRFWGAPIPVWRCERCRTIKAVGSLEEIRKGSNGAITRVVLLRHGESEKNLKNISDRSPNAYPLTRQGRAQAKEAARQIHAMGEVDAVFSSPVLRAKETARCIADAFQKKVEVHEELMEVDSGEWDGRRDDEPKVLAERKARQTLSPEAYYRSKRGTTGESWEEVETRMKKGFDALLAKHAGGSIVLVSHEGPIVFLLKALDNLSFEEADRFFKKDLIGGYAEPIVLYVDSRTGKEFDLHRPFIDYLLLSCDECARTTGAGKNLMRRVPEVFDCWFESGAMPFAQAHYPFNSIQGKPFAQGDFQPKSGWFKKARGFPAHFIAEGLDQTRGWFYSLLVLGTALFKKSPFNAVVVNGTVLAENGAKMSKRLKNYPDPMEVVDKYGADALRFYLLSSPVVRGEDMRFSERGVDEVSKKVFNRLDNVLQFYLLYASSQPTTPPANRRAGNYQLPTTPSVLDQWIVARLNQLIAEVTTSLEAYELDKASRPIGEFVDDLSTWYLRRSRERIKGDALEEKEAALQTLRFVFVELSKVMAPFAPFFAEYLFQSLHATRSTLNAPTSVHLENWPVVSSKFKVQSSKVLEEMEEVRKIVSLGLEARAKAGVKVRQPLQKLKVKSEKLKVTGELRNLIQEEVNVKEVVVGATLQAEVELDTTLTPELKDEGQFRELMRFVQEMRKTKGFMAGEIAVLTIKAEGASRRFIEQHEQELSRVASLKNLLFADTIEGGEVFSADEISLKLLLQKT